MGTKEKLAERFKRQPKDFNFIELIRLFQTVGFEINQKGKTSGSRIEFVNSEKVLSFSTHNRTPTT